MLVEIKQKYHLHSLCPPQELPHVLAD
jgi:hypothetical protein